MRVWLMPSKDYLTKSLLQSYKAQRAVWLRCDQPDLPQLKKLAERFERILILADCQKNKDANLASYISGGVEAFALENRNLSFVQLHMPSLLQALRHSDSNPLPLLGQQQWNHPFFKAMGWQGATWVEDMHAYRSRSAIEAIEVYRVRN
jgi:hypothetical protein